ncbi:ComEA family DNA-binding protein [Deinococcus yavapaiensis]|uniref:Competence protein ComEA n=1 Tax=Deinococcus yavapaiensis KR-236 TaxID=694435 RepID=A0A318S0H4_9DEIO|nr:ComEA family DNA-binding protein [Deinococcus yavapaiensis]PYE48697.1 competence protein ComEA [Deinococcus yavapaiensis KR-236]
MPTDERLVTAALLIAALGCGLWASWPHLFGMPRAPSVTRAGSPVIVPVTTAPSYPTTASVEPLLSGPLNLNTASQEQLEALPKIGPALAKRIVDARPYRSLSDLDAVKGVGPKLIDVLAPLVTFQ